MRIIADIDLGAIVCEICEDNAKVYKSGEYASAKTTDRCGRDLGDVDGSYNRSLSYRAKCQIYDG